MPSQSYPGGARFAFTVVDDTDVATVANVAPLYRLLEELGFRTTKTVWPLAYHEGPSDYTESQTLEDSDYRAFVQDLGRRGFEITWHGATMESSTRERTMDGLDRFRAALGEYPRLHVNHSYNRENIYWGAERVDDPVLRRFLARFGDQNVGHYQGTLSGSPFYWGDLCQRHFTYARNLTFSEINLARVNPNMPYRDPARPLVPWWFSSSDADNVLEFNQLLRDENQERLESEGGFCIVATHFGKGFVNGGRVHPETRRLLEQLAARRGWFPTASELLDWLRARRDGQTLPVGEWKQMQWRWFRDQIVRRVRSRFRGSWQELAA
jgi:hypothetical protein